MRDITWLKQIKFWQVGVGAILGIAISVMICNVSQSRLPGQIAYAKRVGVSKLYKTDPDGTHGEIFGEGDFVENASSPVWSPDGKWIAFGCRTREWGNLCILDAKDTALSHQAPQQLIDMEKLPPGACFEVPGGEGIFVNSVSWAPDSQRLAFTCSQKVCIIDLQGRTECWSATEAVSSDSIDPIYITWSPVAERLALSLTRPDQIFLIDPDGKNAEFLVEGEGPGWSPDGKRLAFFRTEELYLIDSNGSDLERIYEHAVKREDDPSNWWEWWKSFRLYFDNVDNNKVTWSPNARYIAFSASRDGSYAGIYVMKLSTREINLITILGDGGFYSPDWSR